MKVIIELNVHEIRQTLQDGSLAALSESVCGVENKSLSNAKETFAQSGASQEQVAAVPEGIIPVTPPMAVPPVIAQPAPITPPAAVPVTAQTYSADQLAVAATQIADAGRRVELIRLLETFGVQALTMLPKEQYGAFATKLREMGAKI